MVRKHQRTVGGDGGDINVIFDHTAFPTIVDTILQHAPWSVISAFRQTSKAFYARANAIQGEHVVLSTYYSNIMTVTSPYGRIPSLQGRHYEDWARPRKKKMKASLERAQVVLGHTRIVDQIGIGDLSLQPISRALTSVKTLRLHADKQGCMCYKSSVKADTLVIFVHSGFVQVQGYDQTLVEGWVKKLVLNLLFDSTRPDAVFPALLDPDEHAALNLEEVVLVFTNWRGEDSEGTSTEDMVRGPDLRTTLGRYADSLDYGSGTTRLVRLIDGVGRMLTEYSRRQFKITVVDLDTMDPKWLGFKHGSGAQLLDDFVGIITEALTLPGDLAGSDGQVALEDTVQAAVRSIHFVSGDEYASRLSPEERVLETVKEIGTPVAFLQ